MSHNLLSHKSAAEKTEEYVVRNMHKINVFLKNAFYLVILNMLKFFCHFLFEYKIQIPYSNSTLQFAIISLQVQLLFSA